MKLSLVVRHSFVLSLVLIFAISFANILETDWDLIFQKDLLGHDELVNSVVSANLTRQIYPAVVRVNPLIEKFQGWLEGPHWQHIPPLFAYVPLPFFKIDGQVTIEIKRLSYAVVQLLTGILFILTIYLFENKIIAAISATLAAILWAATPFSRNLITGVAFGTSDIVLALAIVCSFAVICWYLSQDTESRRSYTSFKLMLMGVGIALPIVVKNVLGAIPAATFFIILLYDQRKINRKVLSSFISFVSCILIYYGSLYASSPETFVAEIFVSFKHTEDFEGWGRPWYYFITHYFPRYFGTTRPILSISNIFPGICYLMFGSGIILGNYYLLTGKFKGKTARVLTLSGIWFLLNLVTVSAIKSKAPNFIYQSYLIALFFCIYSLILILQKPIATYLTISKLNSLKRLKSLWKKSVYVLLVITILLAVKDYTSIVNKISETRNSTYNYDSKREKYYQFGEFARASGWSIKDIFLLKTSSGSSSQTHYTETDFYFRYYILFMTGSEARTIDEFLAIARETSSSLIIKNLKKKYQRLHLVLDKLEKIPDIPSTIVKNEQHFAEFTIVSIELDSLDNLDFIQGFKSQ